MRYALWVMRINYTIKQPAPERTAPGPIGQVSAPLRKLSRSFFIPVLLILLIEAHWSARGGHLLAAAELVASGKEVIGVLADRFHLCRVIIGDPKPKIGFDLLDETNDVERVGAEVCHETRVLGGGRRFAAELAHGHSLYCREHLISGRGFFHGPPRARVDDGPLATSGPRGRTDGASSSPSVRLNIPLGLVRLTLAASARTKRCARREFLVPLAGTLCRGISPGGVVPDLEFGSKRGGSDLPHGSDACISPWDGQPPTAVLRVHGPRETWGSFPNEAVTDPLTTWSFGTNYPTPPCTLYVNNYLSTSDLLRRSRNAEFVKAPAERDGGLRGFLLVPRRTQALGWYIHQNSSG